MSRKEKIDLFLNKWVSRKLTVFVVASSGLFSGYITSTDWVIVPLDTDLSKWIEREILEIIE